MNLEGFSWSNPLRKIYDTKEESHFYNIYLDCDEYLVYLTEFSRLREDYRNFSAYNLLKAESDFHDKMFDKARNLADGCLYRSSPEEIQESTNLRHWEFNLMLDYESFVIFSKILMDKLGKLAGCLINGGVNSIATKLLQEI